MKESRKTRFRRFTKAFKREWQLHLMVLFPVVYLIIFDYIPMYGMQIAFRDFRPKTKIWGSKWVGLKWFKDFTSSPDFGLIFMNTIILSLYSLATFPIPIIFALLLNAMKGERYKKVVQTISYMPHFISTTVMVGMFLMLASPISGIYGNIYRMFGGTGYPLDFRATAAAFRHIYIWTGEWQGLGWSAIIYLASLSSVSSELHEAAQIDGASRFKRIWYVDIPSIMPTIAMKLVLACTGIIGVGFEKAFLLQSSLNLSVSEVISTYIYKKGMASFRNYSYGAAVGMFQTVINMFLMILVNTAVSKATDGEISMY